LERDNLDWNYLIPIPAIDLKNDQLRYRVAVLVPFKVEIHISYYLITLEENEITLTNHTSITLFDLGGDALLSVLFCIEKLLLKDANYHILVNMYEM